MAVELGEEGLFVHNAGKLELADVAEPMLHRETFTYDTVPRLVFDGQRPAMSPAPEMWITDTTFRDGQQSRQPYTPKQMVALFDFMHRLGGKRGLIRQCEFFLYTESDRKAVELCQDKGYRFPEVTSWIRAVRSDFELVKKMGIAETGVLVSSSDYHIFKKMKLSRKQALDQYLGVVKDCLAVGVKPRCHFEDLTRADIYGFVIPMVQQLQELGREAKVPMKVRMCDTLGFGVESPDVALPRGVPKLVQALRRDGGVPSDMLEWHGHNDFWRGVPVATSAWLYGASAVNCALLGIGERTGNCALEAMVIEYLQLHGACPDIDTTIITEIADYYSRELDYTVPARYPFVGKDFNLTRAGIHADGLLKDEEIYNIFDTKKLLNREVGVAIGAHSGAAGILHWLRGNCPHLGGLSKGSPLVVRLLDWVNHQYLDGRVTSMSDEELNRQVEIELQSLISN